MLFPEFARFGMTLKSMKDREDKRAVNFLLETVFTPVCVGVVNGYKRSRSVVSSGLRMTLPLNILLPNFFLTLVPIRNQLKVFLERAPEKE